LESGSLTWGDEKCKEKQCETRTYLRQNDSTRYAVYNFFLMPPLVFISLPSKFPIVFSSIAHFTPPPLSYNSALLFNFSASAPNSFAPFLILEMTCFVICSVCFWREGGCDNHQNKKARVKPADNPTVKRMPCRRLLSGQYWYKGERTRGELEVLKVLEDIMGAWRVIGIDSGLLN
jgi:hypothetical protein